MSDEIEPHIFKKFEILQKLGKGAYGIVWKALEKKTKRIVALKKVFEAFHNDTDAQRTFREVMILQQLSGHDNVIKLLNVIKAENKRDLYLVFEFMETDLHAVIKAGILKKEHKQYIIYQLLKGLKYIHSGEIVHRDLKPPNLLVNSECLIKIADFGLARSVCATEEETDPIMTEYVATRWYRAPEIVLGSNRYTKSVDIWSVGCILAELINEKPLFPGKSTYNQIELILEVIGKPSQEDVESINSQNAHSILSSITTKRKSLFASFFRDSNPIVLDFLKRCLEFNPEKRITVDEALAHEYVKAFRDEKEEIVCTQHVTIKINDNVKLSTKEYREALYNDIVQKKKDERKEWRQNYLRQLGIPTVGENAKRDLLKQLMSKKREVKDAPMFGNEKPVDNSKTGGKEAVKMLQNSRSTEVMRLLQRDKSDSKTESGKKERPQGKPLQPPNQNAQTEANENSGPFEHKTSLQTSAEKGKKRSVYDSRTNLQQEHKTSAFIARDKPLSVQKIGSSVFSKQSNVAARDFLSKPATSIYDFAKQKTQVREQRLSPGLTAGSPQNNGSLFKAKPQSFQKLSTYYHSLLSNASKKKE